MKLLIAAALLSMTLAGCTTGEVEFTKLTPDAEGKVHVDMTSALTFSPSHFEIPAGTTIVFTSTGSQHNVASYDKAWATSPLLSKGESWELTLDEPGEYGFYCVPHEASGMKGVIRVVAGDATDGTA